MSSSLLALARRLPWPHAMYTLRDVSRVLLLFFQATLLPSVIRRRLKVSSPPRSERPTLLVLSYYAPPYRSSFGTQRVTKFVKHLDREGWRVIVVTTKPEPAEIGRGEDVLPPSVRVVRLPQRITGGLHKRGLAVPDQFVAWVSDAVTAVRSIAQGEAIDVLLATAPPYSNMLAGTICSEALGVPLVCDFRDPWSRVDFGWRVDKFGARHLNRLLERLVLRRADRVLMTASLDCRREYFAAPPRRIDHKLVSILNGYDEDDFAAEQPPVPPDRFVVSVVGTIYDDQMYAAMRAPFEVWKRRAPDEVAQCALAYAGRSSDSFRAVPFPCVLLDRRYEGHADAVQTRRASHVQLFCLSSVFSPFIASARIYEMVRAEPPILALVDPTSAAGEVVLETGTGVAVGHDVERAADFLQERFAEWAKSGRVAPLASRNDEAIGAFAREDQARELSKVLAECVGRPEPERRPDLLGAARTGDSAAVERAIAAGADLNAADRRGRTPLHLAVKHGHHDVAARLLAAGADFNQTDRSGRLALAPPAVALADIHAVRQRYQRLPRGDAAPAEVLPVVEAALPELRTNGFARVSGLVTPAQLARLRDGFEAFVAVVEAKRVRGEALYRTYHEEEYWRDDDNSYVTNNAFKYAPELAEFATQPALLQLAASYLKKPAFIQRAYAMRYPPSDGADGDQFGWHHDMEERRMKIMLLLTDVGEADQYMSYACGTHTIFHPYERFLRNNLEPDYCRSQVGEFDVAQATGVAGDFFVFDSNGMHRGKRTRGRVRDVFFIEYSSDRFNIWGGDIDPEVVAALSPDGQRAFSRFVAVEEKTWDAVLERPRIIPSWATSVPDLSLWV